MKERKKEKEMSEQNQEMSKTNRICPKRKELSENKGIVKPKVETIFAIDGQMHLSAEVEKNQRSPKTQMQNY